jgi:uncharacterized membrane protein YhaH (DUF805 family)
LIIVGALLGYVIGVYPAAMFSSGYKLIGLYSASILAIFIVAIFLTISNTELSVRRFHDID